MAIEPVDWSEKDGLRDLIEVIRMSFEFVAEMNLG